MSLWWRDEIFADEIPDAVPPGGSGPTRRVSGGVEWSGPIAPYWTPPAGVAPVLAGTVLDGRVDPRDVAAVLVDLMLRGHLVVTRAGSKDWRFTLPARPPRTRLSDPAELALFTAVFGTDPVGPEGVLLSQCKQRLAPAIKQVQADARRACVERGWYSSPPGGRGLFRHPRTALGTAIRIQTLGFKHYLETAEAPQIRVDQAAQIFTRYLPYAVAFDCADHFGRVLEQALRSADAQQFLGTGSDVAWSALSGVLDVTNLAFGVLDLVSVVGDLGGGFDALGGLFDAADGCGSCFDVFDVFDLFN